MPRRHQRASAEAEKRVPRPAAPPAKVIQDDGVAPHTSSSMKAPHSQRGSQQLLYQRLRSKAALADQFDARRLQAVASIHMKHIFWLRQKADLPLRITVELERSRHPASFVI